MGVDRQIIELKILIIPKQFVLIPAASLQFAKHALDSVVLKPVLVNSSVSLSLSAS